MRLTLTKPLSFIRKPDLLSFDITTKNGFFVITEGKFKQIIKESEYKAILKSVNHKEIVEDQINKVSPGRKSKKRLDEA